MYIQNLETEQAKAVTTVEGPYINDYGRSQSAGNTEFNTNMTNTIIT